MNTSDKVCVQTEGQVTHTAGGFLLVLVPTYVVLLFIHMLPPKLSTYDAFL